ncbi:MAG: VIT family protein [Propionibacteriaceae bacterium]|jgi:VIT1/CCC1 family predicted Fe2+/Mn2+ transporter|nr:VIT family protein [Propionibacteriaceae bacterium]
MSEVAEEAASQSAALASKLNWLRAGVLGANDGIVSIAGIVMGVAGATAESSALLIAGLAGLVAGALSMAGGEYVSVSTQKDTETAAVAEVRQSLRDDPAGALAGLAESYERKGLEPALAQAVARQLMAHDALDAQTEARLGIDAGERTSPWHAAFASLVAFTVGGVIPLLAMVLSAAPARIWATVAAVEVALVLTGSVSARLGGAAPVKPAVRNVVVGTLTMALTYLVGHLVGVAV